VLIGHYAPAFVIKSIDKTIPLWLLFIAVQVVDIAWAFLVLIGVEKVRIVPGINASNPLDLYYFPFSHSLLAALIWSAIAFTAYKILPIFRGTRRAALLVGAGVLFHWFLDLLVHRPDLPLFGDLFKVGLGLWDHPAAALVLEAGIALGSILLYLRSTTAVTSGGKYGMLLFGLAMLLLQIGSSLGPPPPSSQALAVTMLAYYLCAVGIVFWLEKKRQ
jgi:hypothetical protein